MCVNSERRSQICELVKSKVDPELTAALDELLAALDGARLGASTAGDALASLQDMTAERDQLLEKLKAAEAERDQWKAQQAKVCEMASGAIIAAVGVEQGSEELVIEELQGEIKRLKLELDAYRGKSPHPEWDSMTNPGIGLRLWRRQVADDVWLRVDVDLYGVDAMIEGPTYGRIKRRIELSPKARPVEAMKACEREARADGYSFDGLEIP